MMACLAAPGGGQSKGKKTEKALERGQLGVLATEAGDQGGCG